LTDKSHTLTHHWNYTKHILFFREYVFVYGYAMGGITLAKKKHYTSLLVQRDQRVQDASRQMSPGQKVVSIREMIITSICPDYPVITRTTKKKVAADAAPLEISTAQIALHDGLKEAIMDKLGMAKWTSCYATLKVCLVDADEWRLICLLIHGVATGQVQGDAVRNTQ
jgi:hypothetical protein